MVVSGEVDKDQGHYLKIKSWDFPSGPVVKNPPCNAGDMGSIPGGGTRIPHAMGQPASHNKRLHMPNATK